MLRTHRSNCRAITQMKICARMSNARRYSQAWRIWIGCLRTDCDFAVFAIGDPMNLKVPLLLVLFLAMEVQSPEGKVLLRAEVAAVLNKILGSPKVHRVYYTEFVVD